MDHTAIVEPLQEHLQCDAIQKKIQSLQVTQKMIVS